MLKKWTLFWLLINEVSFLIWVKHSLHKIMSQISKETMQEKEKENSSLMKKTVP